MKSSKFNIQYLFSAFWVLPFVFLTGCVTGSMPNLEKPECEASRSVVKQFYSFHFGNEMKFSLENLKPREKFLTPEYTRSLQTLQTENDVFTTNSADLPRAFKLGACQVIEASQTKVEVLLFWRDENSTQQKSITAEVFKQGDKWLINKILY